MSVYSINAGEWLTPTAEHVAMIVNAPLFDVDLADLSEYGKIVQSLMLAGF